ncbi:MAG: orotate phosphoribosyltransferase [Candidatus Methanolliviera hydrocarbonicum]|uniref:Orotate phosphoribosyltransferase n=1 Tax=Candidatus Methanolliviera hydrocarbonicum TaxID=2491085 RepID=A0A520KYG9_9EURY|nr:MAG: orotate phosphoribosyltransferase [Candidatus Methanolliviera hydrocarbonicum]
MIISEMIKDSGALKVGSFTLSSGKKSSYYVDKYLFETSPGILKKISEEMIFRIEREFDIIAGPEMGAIPLITALSLKTEKPFLIVRKKDKDYGTKSKIEGNLKEGDKVLFVEDVTTTGESLLKAIRTVEEVGGVITEVLIVVDREEGAVERMKKLGYDVNVLLRMRELI